MGQKKMVWLVATVATSKSAGEEAGSSQNPCMVYLWIICNPSPSANLIDTPWHAKCHQIPSDSTSVYHHYSNITRRVRWFTVFQKMVEFSSSQHLSTSVRAIGSMYAIDGNIYHQYTPNVSIYTSTMDPMGRVDPARRLSLDFCRTDRGSQCFGKPQWPPHESRRHRDGPAKGRRHVFLTGL